MNKRRAIAITAFILFLVLAFVSVTLISKRISSRAAGSRDTVEATITAHPAFLYGRVTTLTGATYEGRLSSADGEEQFWTDLFNGVRAENQWSSQVPEDRLPTVKEGFEVFGMRINQGERPADLSRPFVTRLGNVQRIDAESTSVVRVTMKNGNEVVLNRMDASDFDDGVHIWAESGIVKLDNKIVRSIELLDPPASDESLVRLHGTVATEVGTFAGWIRWNREDGLRSDVLRGRHGDRDVTLRFDEIRAIAREPESARVTLTDGTEMILSGTRETGKEHRGIHVDDERYGRATIPWNVFQRIDFDEGGSAPTFSDFPPGHPLSGSVTTSDGRELEGRLVFDLDESETTDTLDAPFNGINYHIPFGLISSIVPASDPESETDTAIVVLRSGEETRLAPRGDLGGTHGGMLIFVEGVTTPEYVPWSDVRRIDLTPADQDDV